MIMRWAGQGYIKNDWMYYLQTKCKAQRILVDYNAISALINDTQRFLVAYTEQQERMSRRLASA